MVVQQLEWSHTWPLAFALLAVDLSLEAALLVPGLPPGLGMIAACGIEIRRKRKGEKPAGVSTQMMRELTMDGSSHDFVRRG